MSLALGFEEPKISNSDDPIFPMPKETGLLSGFNWMQNKQTKHTKEIYLDL